MEEAYSSYLDKNRGIRDILFIVVLFFLNISLLVTNLILNECSPSEIGLRVAGLLFLALLFFLSQMLHSHSFVTWIFIAVFMYYLTIEKVDELSRNKILTR